MGHRLPRIAVFALSGGISERKRLSVEDRYLLFIRIYTGADYRVPRIDPDEARHRFLFEGGLLPQNGAAYFRHPFYENRYMTPSTTNVHIAREKVFVFNRIAASLGAKTITLKSSTIESRRGGLFARGKTSPGQVAAQVGIEAQFDEPNKLLIQTQSKLGIPKSDPSVPAEIERWVFADPALENLVKTRLESDLLQQSVTLELSETSQYAGSAVAKYANLGFEVAGRYQSLLRSLWHYEVEFWPKGRK